MKLLFAIKRLDGLAGGSERVICSVASSMAARGHDVTLVTFDRPGAQPFFPIDARVNRCDLGVGDSSRPANWQETVRRIVRLRREIVTIGPDVAVGFGHSMFIPLSLALARSGIPVVGSQHTVPEHYKTRPLQWALLIALSPLITRYTVLSEKIRDRHPRALRQRMTPIQNPVPPRGRNKECAAGTRERVILSVGRLDPEKDHETLLQAFAMVAPRFPQWRVRIIGDGPLKDHLVALAGDARYGSRVEILGTKPNIHEEYRRASIFALPSRYESFGLVIAEAMQHRLPVVGFSDCPGTNELITHEETGLLADGTRSRTAAFAEQLGRLMQDAELRLNLGRAAQSYVGERFDPDTIYDLWEDLLKRTAGRANHDEHHDPRIAA